MKLLIDIKDLDKYKSRDKIPLECEYCKNVFYQFKSQIQAYLKGNTKMKFKFCSQFCCGKANAKKQTDILCKNCNKTFNRPLYHRSKNHFCSLSCAATYNNKHKTHGNRRSKLEYWLESKLTELYPKIDVIYNDRQQIGYELDIYVPSLYLAFELNGIFHYEPIYGQNRLDRTQYNDNQKFALCQQKLISLCVIDTTSLKYFKEQNAQKFLNIITNIIDEKIGGDAANLSAGQ